ncbi:MAG: nicotinamide mononucleotide transporter [Saprospirales bacterium]|nr:nicotinamide mononucleotide transporter [Saprospirales bacterium]
MQFWNSLLNQIAAQHFSEWAAVIGAILYLLLATKGNPWCWVWGIISCAFWAYAAFALYGLYIDGALQLFYIAISVLGIYRWKYGGKDHQELPISRLHWKQHIWIWTGGLALSWALGAFFEAYTAAAATYLDAFTTVFSVIITFMVIQKKLENWGYWFLIDSVYVYLYWSRRGFLIALLFVTYLVIVVFGYFSWRKSYLNAV